MKHKILDLLKENKEEFISGQRISEYLGVSRAAIWKYIKALKGEGYEIESVSRNGYRLISCPDILNYDEVKNYLNTKYIGRNIEYFETIDSTNMRAKEIAMNGGKANGSKVNDSRMNGGKMNSSNADSSNIDGSNIDDVKINNSNMNDSNMNCVKEGTVIVSEEQTLGRGRLGRKWISPKYKGIWMSIILRPNINPANVSKITHIGAAAVNKAIEDMGVKTYIKWPNDIVINDKKVCGILTEMSGEMDNINYVVMGIGINVNIDKEEFDDEIKEIATSLKVATGKDINRKKLMASILNYFEEFYNEFIENGTINKTLDICRKNSIVLGKQVRIIRRGQSENVIALQLNDEGELIIRHEDGKIEKLISGEISMRYTPGV
ncbi:bifunctional ligase/repressor BirA [Clostridium tepidiprofundi DSM 19306]|uniref:Bifunctional ligase/repressor BirA n=1 Tax=Clostridium tepidiprofundi DSM 19306 TaxID=1121338 RepID=A0A151B2T5_9CLOT|nr:biotin--[acetyl-CoA-carboxylase] ligase [Clostridium tepidiprofundi]KYH34206.1 bifunctional ligase/repressor BirA [Clostridium tepidiprofundi DSM 19306]